MAEELRLGINTPVPCRGCRSTTVIHDGDLCPKCRGVLRNQTGNRRSPWVGIGLFVGVVVIWGIGMWKKNMGDL